MTIWVVYSDGVVEAFSHLTEDQKIFVEMGVVEVFDDERVARAYSEICAEAVCALDDLNHQE